MSDFIEIPASKSSLSRRRLVYGIGVNDADYKVSYRDNGKKIMCPIYSKWFQMIRRCYSLDYHKIFPSYSGCEVSKEWLVFSNFRKWMKSQDWKGKDLDKDIKILGNRKYSAETCIFVDRFVNSFFKKTGFDNNGLPDGVSISSCGGFIARGVFMNKKEYLGHFLEKRYAILAYCQFKIKSIYSIQSNPDNLNISKFLFSHIDYYAKKIEKTQTGDNQ